MAGSQKKREDRPMNRIRRIYEFLFIRHRRASLIGIAALALAYIFCLPRPLFDDPTSMVLEDRKGNLLGARIAADGQWRFPPPDSLPGKFIRALVEFEDRRFYYHPGVDPISLGRAFAQNIRRGGIVSGGSTITMQVIRMARDNPPRTLFQKAIEMIMATRLELGRSKEDILLLYAANAPFGGNVVGVDAASWRYFAKRPHLLSWGEAAMLAVLPNSPALIHPGRNRETLLAKRNRLLDRLMERGAIDSLTCALAKDEPLPDHPHPLPRLAPHLLDRAFAEYVKTGKIKKSRIRTTLDGKLQTQLTEILSRYQQMMRHNEVHNLAAFIMDVETNNVLAYVGNVIGAGEEHGEQVDVITARRSTGSILKPFLYAWMLQEGEILPNSLVTDVPTIMSGYRPENFHEEFDGVVTARRALIRSLNVPMIRMLSQYGLEKFHFRLRQLGLKTIDKPPHHYGLPLVLGGAEASLWDVTNAYACMSRMLTHVYQYDGRYDPGDFRPANYLASIEYAPPDRDDLQKEPSMISASAAWFTFDAMQYLERPNSEGEWEAFRSNRRIAWKTGTSFGFRDAWAVGVTPRYAIGVWAGNASGEGRPGLIGVKVAAPVLFDIVNRLPETGGWFRPPYDEMTRIPICRQSGYRALDICPADTTGIPLSGLQAAACPYHQLIHLDASEQWQVHSDCEQPFRIVHKPWFVLPPVEEFYYRPKNPNYRTLPPFREDCRESRPAGQAVVMELIYPKHVTQIYVPVDLDGELSRTVFAVAHRNPAATIHWHIDEDYVGSTSQFHSMSLNPPQGKHLLTLVDEDGNRLEQRFEIIGKSVAVGSRQ
jgi:penicillin-binding protein 1C